MTLTDQVYRHIIRVEGTAFVNHPNDPGGATRYGITQATYDAWNTGLGFPLSSVEDITEREVRQIYDAKYWQDGWCNRMQWPFNLLHFDGYVNHPPAAAWKVFQRTFGAVVDGVPGPETMYRYELLASRPALREYLIDRYIMHRALWYGRIARAKDKLQVFLPGWLRRIEILRETAYEPEQRDDEDVDDI